MRQSKLDIIFRENNIKLKKFKLKTDPVDSSRSYIGYMLHEKPVKKTVTIEQSTLGKATDSVIGGAGKVLKTIGGAVKGLESAAIKFDQIAGGDLSKLQDIGNYLLDKIFDKITGKVMMLGKKGYTRVNLNDDNLIIALNDYRGSGVKKESYIVTVTETLRKVRKSIITRHMKGKQMELPLDDDREKQLQKIRWELWLQFQNMSPEQKKKVGELIRKYKQEQALKNTTVKEQTEPLDTFVQKASEADIIDIIQGETEDESDSQENQFNEENLFFNIVNQREFSTGTQFLLVPESTKLKQSFTEVGISHITLFRPKENNINSLDALFYKDKENVIPQLIFPNLKYIYDVSKKAYIVNSKIATKKTPTVFKHSLPVPINSVDIIYKDEANKQIKFNFKPEAFTQEPALEKFKDKFVQHSSKTRLGNGDLYASVGAPFTYSEGKDYYILDLSKLVISFDRNARFYPENVTPQKTT